MAVKWEYELGPLTVNLRVLLEPKGFIRIIMMVSAWAGLERCPPLVWHHYSHTASIAPAYFTVVTKHFKLPLL